MGILQVSARSRLRAPATGEELCWREQRTPPPIVGRDDHDYLDGDGERIALGFDLRLPLKEQLEQARTLLIAEQQRRRRAGLVAARVATARERWTSYRRALDAQAQQATRAHMAQALTRAGGESAVRALLARAHACERRLSRDPDTAGMNMRASDRS